MSGWLRRLAPWLAVSVIAFSAWWLWPTGGGAPPSLLDPAALLAALREIDQPAADAGTGTAQTDASSADTDWIPALPRDLGPHPSAPAEVWDLTGQLRDDTGDRYDLRLTLVRLAIGPRGIERASQLAANALLLGHFELAPADGAPVIAQRASRIAAELAGIVADPPRIWLEDWTLTLDKGGESTGRGRLEIRIHDLRLDLTLIPAKPAVTPSASLLEGGAPAGREPGAATSLRWLALPRLALAGELTAAGRVLAVSGAGWLDRVWGVTAAAAGLTGTRGQLALNRFLLLLEDGSELLCMQLRRRAGGGTPIPTCLAVAADGATTVLRRRALTLVPGDATWRSLGDGVRYPIRWRLAAPALGLELRIDALRPTREQRPAEWVWGGQLWSSAISVSGERDGRAVVGGGRMDLSGYAGAADG